MSAPRAIAGGIYYLSGVLVKAETKEVAKKLIAKGFRTATDGIKNSGLKVQTVTNSNFVTFVTRALKKAMEQSQKIRQGPKLDPKTGRPEGRGQGNNKLGGSGQSEMGRRLGSRRMKNFGDVRGGKPRAESMARSKPKPQSPVKPVSARPGNFRTGKQDKVNPALSAAPTIAGLVAAGAIGKVAYDAYIENKSPTVTQIKTADEKIAAIKARKTSTQVQRKARADAAAKRKDRVSKEGSLVGDAGTKSKRQKLAAAKADAERKNTPERKKTINRAVRLAALGGGEGIVKLRKDAEKKALTEVLNKKIASRKSTVAKEKAKARAGEYKSLASAKKAGSLYYMHKGKELRAAITEEETRSAFKRIRREAEKKITEGK